MKKILLSLFAVFALVGCSNTQDKETKEESKVVQNEEVTQHFEVVITKNEQKEMIKKEALEFNEGDTLMEVMKENFELETAYEGTFITGINGVVADEKESESWFYSINGEEAMVGASEYELKDGDLIEFDLHKWN